MADLHRARATPARAALGASTLLGLAALGACHRSQPASGPTLEVHVDVPGSSAAEVEASTTAAIERACSGASHVAHLHGASVPGRASVTVELERGADAEAALAELQGKLRSAGPSLPPGAMPPVLTRGHGRLVGRYTTSSEFLSPAEVHEAQQAAWLRRLEGTAGVGAIETCGDVVARVAVNVDASALAGAGLTVAEVAATLSRPAPHGGALAFSALVLATVGGAPVRVRDVAKVADEASPTNCRAYDERGAVFEAAIYAQPSVDPEKVRASVAAALGRARVELPPGVDVRPWGAVRTVTVDLDPAVSVAGAVAALRDAVKTAAGTSRFAVELDTPGGPDAGPTGARAVLDTSDDAVVQRVTGALLKLPAVRSAGEPNATVTLVGSDRSALLAAAPELYRRLAERGLLVARLGLAEQTLSVPRIDRDLARQLGVSTGDVELALEALHGKVISSGGSGGHGVPVMLRLAAPLDHVFVRTGPATAPLSAFVTMTTETSARILLLEDQMAAVGARVHATDLAGLQHLYDPPAGLVLRVAAD